MNSRKVMEKREGWKDKRTQGKAKQTWNKQKYTSSLELCLNDQLWSHFCEPPEGTDDYPTSRGATRGTSVRPKTPPPKRAARGGGHVWSFEDLSRMGLKLPQNWTSSHSHTQRPTKLLKLRPCRSHANKTNTEVWTDGRGCVHSA